MVSEGIQQRHLRIQRYTTADRVEVKAHHHIHNLDEYMLAYGRMLGKQAERSLHPLHVPGRDALPALDLLREPFEAQRHVIEAVRKALQRQKAVLLVGEMGTGKTLMAMAACHAHTAGSPYRGLVFCPGQLVNKWEREIRETIAGAEVMQIHSWTTLLHLDAGTKPGSAQWYVIARDRAKLGARWQPAFQVLKHGDDGFLRCPHCGRRLVDDQREPLRVGKPAHNGRPGTGLWKRRSTCEWVLTNPPGAAHAESSCLVEGCGSPLWQMNGEIWRYEPALFIKRRLRTFFDYLILDEVHEEKGADTAQGNAAGALASCCRKVIALTGTLIGGYAEHLRPLLFRLAPDSLVQEGLGWSNVMAFNERYGRIETRITSKSGGDDNRMSRGSKSTTKSVRPGIMPVLFGRHLIDKAVFLSLAEVADNLPPLHEECVAVPMDEELARAYRDKVEKPLAEAIRAMMRRQDRRLLGAMLQTLLAYPDYPFGWGPVGYWERGEGSGPGKYVTVAMPPNLSEDVLRPKEQALLELAKSEKAVRRKVWVYVQFTDKHDVQGRLQRLLQQAGFQVAVLRASTPPAKREEWIAAHAPTVDVVISHPRLVETGLDLFDKGGRHNFPTICFYETGYNLFTLRQASRRSWRIDQKERCRIVYFHYAGTMQERAMALMGKKLTAAQALEGTFTSEGLVALAGEDANVEIALARSLVERMEEGDARRHWTKVFNPRQREARVPTCGSTTEGLSVLKSRRRRIGSARAATRVGPQKLLF
jgi:SNF2 family DNA or RNA helicase